MKKFLIMLIALTALCGCEKKENTSQPDEFSTITQEDVENSAVPETSTTAEIQTTASITNVSGTVTQTATTEISTVFNTVSTTIQQDSDRQPDPLDNSFSYDENGMPEADQTLAESDDRRLIAIGQSLFEIACDFQWKFTVGCPYEIDTNSTVQNGFGWTYYKIINSNIHSLADIENIYYGVFSDRYPNEDLKMLYLDFEGDVYALNGQREMNPYYSFSRIKDVQSRTDDKIFFTVENYFEGTDMNPDESYSETETFSIVTYDNKIRIGQFRLPY
ncbi:MAG: hypothetical protein K2J40_01590 [Ruminococcus sp.]|nr:hypothetical protein [Ruminococcus sp.]